MDLCIRLFETTETLGHYANVLISAGTLKPGGVYFLTLTITILGENVSGMNQVKIHASTGPTGGSCEINPRTGKCASKRNQRYHVLDAASISGGEVQRDVCGQTKIMVLY